MMDPYKTLRVKEEALTQRYWDSDPKNGNDSQVGRS